MTKETKIGLLVGLAFIILFAIILSEKGATNKNRSPSTLTLAKGPAAEDGSFGQSGEPLSDAGRLPVSSQRPGQIQAARNQPAPITANPSIAGQPIPAEGDPIAPLPASVVDRLNGPRITPSAIAKDASPLETESMSLAQALAAALEAPPKTSPTAPVEDDPDSLPGRPDTPARRSIEQPETTMKTIAVHSVRRGESLGKIAAKYYGRSTPARVDAIFNANRGTLKSIHSVRANDKLKIPQLDITQQIAFEPVSHFAPQEIMAGRSAARETEVRIPIPMDPDAGPAADRGRTNLRTTEARRPEHRLTEFRWYRIRAKDTLSRIAKRELGDEGRFGEIYRLNKDVIPNKNRIKPGMKIRLPLRSRSTGRSSAALTTLTVADELMP